MIAEEVTSSANSSPDLSTANNTIITRMDLSTRITLSSDHIPIINTINKEVMNDKSKNQWYINSNRADRYAFTRHTEGKFIDLLTLTNVHQAEDRSSEPL